MKYTKKLLLNLLLIAPFYTIQSAETLPGEDDYLLGLAKSFLMNTAHAASTDTAAPAAKATAEAAAKAAAEAAAKATPTPSAFEQSTAYKLYQGTSAACKKAYDYLPSFGTWNTKVLVADLGLAALAGGIYYACAQSKEEIGWKKIAKLAVLPAAATFVLGNVLNPTPETLVLGAVTGALGIVAHTIYRKHTTTDRSSIREIFGDHPFCTVGSFAAGALAPKLASFAWSATCSAAKYAYDTLPSAGQVGFGLTMGALAATIATHCYTPAAGETDPVETTSAMASRYATVVKSNWRTITGCGLGTLAAATAFAKYLTS